MRRRQSKIIGANKYFFFQSISKLERYEKGLTTNNLTYGEIVRYFNSILNLFTPGIQGNSSDVCFYIKKIWRISEPRWNLCGYRISKLLALTLLLGHGKRSADRLFDAWFWKMHWCRTPWKSLLKIMRAQRGLRSYSRKQSNESRKQEIATIWSVSRWPFGIRLVEHSWFSNC